jgi:hypothetical protein
MLIIEKVSYLEFRLGGREMVVLARLQSSSFGKVIKLFFMSVEPKS